MVVRQVMRWSPWAPPTDATTAARRRKKRYLVKIRIAKLEGLFLGEAKGAVAVEIRWKGPARAGGGLSYLRRRNRKPARGVTGEGAVRGGEAEWEEEDAAAFEHVCGFSAAETGGAASFGDWDVSFHLLLSGKGEGGEKKPEEIGTALLNLGELTSQLHEGGEKPSQVHVRRVLPITLQSGSAGRDAMLSVTVSLMEIATSGEMLKIKKNQVRDGPTTDESDNSHGTQSQLLAASARDESSCSSSTCSNHSGGEGDNSETLVRSPPMRRFFSWRKKRKTASDSNNVGVEGQELRPCSSSREIIDTDGKMKTSSEPDIRGEDPTNGNWEEKEFTSRDGKTKLKSQTFFASIDQRDESACGESACAALVAVIAHVLHSNSSTTPTRLEFDTLIREGSSEWRKLCGIKSYTDQFPDKHFDLDTVLEANLRQISVSPGKSYVGFFQPQSFESLRGAMSFDDIWSEITSNVREGDMDVYIVSWNDHFFVLKVEADAYHVIDTLGERLFEGCDKAYILRFDGSTLMYQLPEKEGDGEEELIRSGKDCCGEFIKRFLAAIPLREELEAEEKKGMGNDIAPGQRLQIEFHFTRASN